MLQQQRPEDARRIQEEIKEIKIETTNGSYRTVPAAEMSGADLMRVEGVNATILYKMATTLPAGLQGVYTAFTATNRPDRVLSDLLKQYLHDHPNQLAPLASILDEATFGRLGDAEFAAQLGTSPGLTTWLAGRAKRRADAEAAAAAAAADAIPDDSVILPLPAAMPSATNQGATPVEVDIESGSPFGE